MKSEEIILKTAADALAKQTGLSVLQWKPAKDGSEFDYELEISFPGLKREQTLKLMIDVKRNLNDTLIGNTAIRFMNLRQDTALVSEFITPPQALKLRELNVQFFDTTGNAYLKSPGIFVFVSGNKSRETRPEKPLGLFRPAGIKLLLALLTQPGMENSDYRNIAADTGVPRTTVGELINDLEKSGYLRRRGNKRQLINKKDLIRRWVETYGEKFRVKLDPVRYHSTKHTGRWWENVDIGEYKAVWGGETGGAILTKHLKPQTAAIYADSRLTRLQALHGLVRDENGEIEILQKFWKFGEVGNAAPPLVIYADLVATADERNLETAQMIYDQYLAPLTEENS